MHESLVMLYYIVFYEMTHQPYILESYIIDILVSLSLTLPLICILFFYFAAQLRTSQLIISWFFCFYAKKDFISVATIYNDMANILIWPIYYILTASLDPDNTKQ